MLTWNCLKLDYSGADRSSANYDTVLERATCRRPSRGGEPNQYHEQRQDLHRPPD
jgi:hypothetical protein